MTGYYQDHRRRPLEPVMRLEADRMANLRIIEKEMTPGAPGHPRGTAPRIENVPAELLDEADARGSCSAGNQPYGMPTSGYPEDVPQARRAAS